MPEEKATWADRIFEQVINQVLRGVAKNAQRTMRRVLRMVMIAMAGAIIATLGVAFLAVGSVKWLSLLMPGWLAWSIVGIVLILLGVILALATSFSPR